ncbi:hypothetical protein [Actinopolyspora saharensis]|uniref:hypothetical protein n=1 Tax=Actinopolyspora saharensis TaxID=995062 RepID=UPI003F675FBB
MLEPNSASDARIAGLQRKLAEPEQSKATKVLWKLREAYLARDGMTASETYIDVSCCRSSSWVTAEQLPTCAREVGSSNFSEST